MTSLKLILLAFTFFTPFAQGIECGPTLLSRQIFLDEHFDRAGGRVRIAFFDADKTLRDSLHQPGGFVDEVDDIAILPGVPQTLAKLNSQGYLVVIVSNQAGIPKIRTLAQVDDVLRATVEILRKAGAVVNYYDFAESYDQFRKPQIGMAERLLDNLRRHFGRSFEMDKEHSFMVGDAAYTAEDTRPDGRPGTDRSNSDRIFAENLKIRFYEAAPYFALALRDSSRGR